MLPSTIANLRARTVASIVAIMRDGLLIPNPKSLTAFQIHDRIGLIGEEQQVDAVAELIRSATEGIAPAPERLK